MRSLRTRLAAALVPLALLIAACTLTGPDAVEQHLWWSGLGPVVPHESFPGDCSLCHQGTGWQTLRADFDFDHGAQTGVALEGAHRQASCLRCHNDRGPVATFARAGCGGCHEDVHMGQLGSDCERCHQQWTWRPEGQVALHNRTRFPLVGVHAVTACWRCHPGSEAGKFLPTDTECLTCHRDDLLRAVNPPHIALGYVDRCDRCHLPLTWDQAQIGG